MIVANSRAFADGPAVVDRKLAITRKNILGHRSEEASAGRTKPTHPAIGSR
jgi:hypothetical protein